MVRDAEVDVSYEAVSLVVCLVHSLFSWVARLWRCLMVDGTGLYCLFV